MATLEKSLTIPQNLNIELATIWPINSTWGIYGRELKTWLNKNLYMNVHSSIICKQSKKVGGKNPKVHQVYSATEMNEYNKRGCHMLEHGRTLETSG